MSRTRIFIFTLLAMIAFAGNSLLCRVALTHTRIDPATFTSIRIVAGALTLWLIVRLRSAAWSGASEMPGSWLSAWALFIYAAAFSFAYVSLGAATGALLLFGSVQATMVGYGLWTGERFRGWRLLGIGMALAGLVGLLLPGLSAPPLQGGLLMIAAGVAWGAYTVRGKGRGDPLLVTAGNFIRAAIPAVALNAAMLSFASVDIGGAACALASGALASGVGYAIWYTALRDLKVTNAAAAQLSVPVIAAAGAIVLLDEPLTLRVALGSAVILGGIALVMLGGQRAKR